MRLMTFAIILLALSQVGCERFVSNDSKPLKILRVGVLPDDREDALKRRHTPLLAYLAENLGIEYRLIIPSDYSDFLKKAAANQFDLAYFGGFTFIQSHLKTGVLPLVMRDVDSKFTSYFIVRSGDSARNIEDLRGRKFSFGSKLSTSGHFMPRHFLEEKSIDPESYFSEIQFSGSHDKTVMSVLNGKTDAGVANSLVIERMFASGRVKKEELRILWQTPPYPDYVWGVDPSVSESDRQKILDLFLQLSMDDSVYRGILRAQSAVVFLPADIRDFTNLRKIVDRLKLIAPKK